jgi:ABC-type sugar transport system ATPase subunit
VRALLGKNGAGKSTLVNLISGSIQPDAGGSIVLDGAEVHWSGSAEASRGGIAVVHQELSLVPGLSVAENVLLGQWPTYAGGALVDQATMFRVAGEALDRVGISLPLRTEVGRLSLAQRQLVEIAKSIAFDPRLLILDEPTSSLNVHEADALLALVRRLAATGVAVIFVSHRMQEIPRVADTLTVLRDGREITTMDAATARTEEVAELIAGEASHAIAIVHRDRRAAPVVLSVRGLACPRHFHDVSFDLHEGEVLGIAGLLGSGRTELLQTVFGERPDGRGEVLVSRTAVPHRSPDVMLRHGVGMTSEDRKDSGIFPLLGVAENMMLSARGRTLRGPWVHRRHESELAEQLIAEMGIATSSADKPLEALSGGNQQKSVVARLLAAEMRVLLLDEPTRGVDVQAKARLYQLVRTLADRGVSSVFVSSELEELSQVCDRVLVLRGGTITDDLDGQAATPERLLALTMKESTDVAV